MSLRELRALVAIHSGRVWVSHNRDMLRLRGPHMPMGLVMDREGCVDRMLVGAWLDMARKAEAIEAHTLGMTKSGGAT